MFNSGPESLGSGYLSNELAVIQEAASVAVRPWNADICSLVWADSGVFDLWPTYDARIS